MKELAAFPIASAAKGSLSVDSGNLKLAANGKLGDFQIDLAVGYPVAKIVQPLYDHVVSGLESKLRAIGGIGVTGAEMLEGLWLEGLAKMSDGTVPAAPAAPASGAGEISSPSAPVLSGADSLQGQAQL